MKKSKSAICEKTAGEATVMKDNKVKRQAIIWMRNNLPTESSTRPRMYMKIILSELGDPKP